MRSLYRVLVPLLVPVRKKEENSICCLLQEEREEAQERHKDFPLFVPEAEWIPLTFHLTKGERWELSQGAYLRRPRGRFVGNCG